MPSNQEDAVLSRATGSLLGLAVGDAVGTTLEFEERDSGDPLTDMVGGGAFALPPGYWTDDTSMALCLSDSLLERGRFDARDVMERFRRWYREGENSLTGTSFDIGNTVRDAIEQFEKTEDPVSGSQNPTTAGNGSIMRLAPAAIFSWRDESAAVRLAVDQSEVTHRAPEALEACRLLAVILVRAIQGCGKSDLVKIDGEAFRCDSIKKIASGEWESKRRDEIKSTGYVVDTLEAALWSVNKTGDFREAILMAANLGDDADTVAAVAGQIAGALYGENAIPPSWRERLAWGDRIQKLAKNLYASQETK